MIIRRIGSRQVTPEPDETREPLLTAVLAVVFGVACLTFLIRLYVRAYRARLMGRDDYVMIAAVACAIIVEITFIIQSKNGLGRHLAMLAPAQVKSYTYWGFIQSNTRIIGIGLVKISVAFFLMRLVDGGGRKWINGVLWVLIVSTALYTVFCEGTIIFQCFPVSGAWDPIVRKRAHCYSLALFRNFGFANSLISVVTDVVLATIPIPIVWKLRYSKRHKILIVLNLSLGYFAVVFGIIKGINQVGFLTISDRTFQPDIAFWGSLQVYVAIVAGCVPATMPLLRHLHDSTLGATSSIRERAHPVGEDYSRQREGYGINRGILRLEKMQRNNTTSHAESTASHVVTPPKYVLRKPQIRTQRQISVAHEIPT